jgi:ABC-type Fe3+ transport system permease subunit
MTQLVSEGIALIFCYQVDSFGMTELIGIQVYYLLLIEVAIYQIS